MSLWSTLQWVFGRGQTPLPETEDDEDDELNRTIHSDEDEHEDEEEEEEEVEVVVVDHRRHHHHHQQQQEEETPAETLPGHEVYYQPAADGVDSALCRILHLSKKAPKTADEPPEDGRDELLSPPPDDRSSPAVVKYVRTPPWAGRAQRTNEAEAEAAAAVAAVAVAVPGQRSSFFSLGSPAAAAAAPVLQASHGL